MMPDRTETKIEKAASWTIKILLIVFLAAMITELGFKMRSDISAHNANLAITKSAEESAAANRAQKAFYEQWREKQSKQRPL